MEANCSLTCLLHGGSFQAGLDCTFRLPKAGTPKNGPYLCEESHLANSCLRLNAEQEFSGFVPEGALHWVLFKPLSDSAGKDC